MSENNAYIVNKIDDASWRIEDGPVRMILFAGKEKALLVDSGYGSGDLAGTVAGLTKLPVMLVNTHADYDHIGANPQFERAYMHPSEFARYRFELADRYDHYKGIEPPVSPLWEGDIIDLGGRRFEVILIPGHTPGSIALLDEQNRILLGGDSVNDDVIAMCDQGRNFDAYICSLEKLMRLRSRFDTVYAPHGSFPNSAGILDGIYNGAKSIKNGEIEGVDTDFIPGKKFFNTGAAKFVC